MFTVRECQMASLWGVCVASTAVQWLYNEGRMGKRGCDEIYTLSCTIKYVKRVMTQFQIEGGGINFRKYKVFSKKCEKISNMIKKSHFSHFSYKKNMKFWKIYIFVNFFWRFLNLNESKLVMNYAGQHLVSFLDHTNMPNFTNQFQTKTQHLNTKIWIFFYLFVENLNLI